MVSFAFSWFLKLFCCKRMNGEFFLQLVFEVLLQTYKWWTLPPIGFWSFIANVWMVNITFSWFLKFCCKYIVQAWPHALL
jgi:hypothetical protein